MSQELRNALSNWLMDADRRDETLEEVKQSVRNIVREKAAVYVRLRVRELLPNDDWDERAALVKDVLQRLQKPLEFQTGAYTQSIESDLDAILDDYVNFGPEDIDGFLRPRVERIVFEVQDAFDGLSEQIDDWVKKRGE